MWQTIKNIFGFLQSLFSFLKQKELNSPEIIKKKQLQEDQDFKDKVNEDLKKNNIEELGKDISL